MSAVSLQSEHVVPPRRPPRDRRRGRRRRSAGALAHLRSRRARRILAGLALSLLTAAADRLESDPHPLVPPLHPVATLGDREDLVLARVARAAIEIRGPPASLVG